jgi:WhiB family redox-sensing transcriptional regulator
MTLDVIIANDYPDFMTAGSPVCTTTDPEIFFPEKGMNGSSQYAVDAAKKMCNACPYKIACIDWAVDHDEIGIWGGTTPKDRRKLKWAKIKKDATV